MMMHRFNEGSKNALTIAFTNNAANFYHLDTLKTKSYQKNLDSSNGFEDII